MSRHAMFTALALVAALATVGCASRMQRPIPTVVEAHLVGRDGERIPWPSPLPVEEGLRVARALVAAADGTRLACPPDLTGAGDDAAVICATAPHDAWSFDRAVEPVLFDSIEAQGLTVVDLSEPGRTLAGTVGAGWDRFRFRIGRSWPASTGGVEVDVLIENGAPYHGADERDRRDRMLVIRCRQVPSAVNAAELAEPGR